MRPRYLDRSVSYRIRNRRGITLMPVVFQSTDERTNHGYRKSNVSLPQLEECRMFHESTSTEAARYRACASRIEAARYRACASRSESNMNDDTFVYAAPFQVK